MEELHNLVVNHRGEKTTMAKGAEEVLLIAHE